MPLYILGSSLFGAQLAADLGLPYAFASHFAPAALLDAIDLYRRRFRPSGPLEEPYVMAAMNVIAADDGDDAERQLLDVRRRRVARFVVSPDREITDDEADRILASPQGRQLAHMMHYTAAGDPPTVARRLDDFVAETGADEVMTVHASPTAAERLRSLELLAAAVSPAG